MERVNNNEFRRKGLPDRTQYLKDCDDDNCTSIRYMRRDLKTIIGLLTAVFLMVSGYGVKLIFFT